MGLVLLVVGFGAYVLLRRAGAVGSLLRAHPIPGVLVFALLWIAVMVGVFRWGRRHRRVVRTLGPVGPLAVVCASMPAIGGLLLLFVFMGPLSMFLRRHEALGVAIYIVGFIVFAGLALLPTYAQAILAGWAFGFSIGFPAALAGFLGASLVGYFIAAKASGERIVGTIDKNPKWKAVLDALAGQGFWKTLGIVTLVRVPPNSPFAITNLVMASVRVPKGAYVIGTLVGMAPRTGVAVYLATMIEGQINSEAIRAARPAWMMPVTIVLSLVALGVIGHVANRAIRRVTGQPTPPTQDES